MVIADTDMGSHPAVPSCDGALIAVVDRAQLVIRLCEDGSVKQSYDLPMGFAASCRFMRWYRELETGECSPGRAMNGNWHGAGTSQRVLLADDSRIIVYDITKPQLYAEVDGATTLTKLANVDFGRTPDEIVVFSDFGSKLQIWSLGTKRAIEIKDVKSISACYSYRPKSGHLALLTRPAAHDILMIIAPQTHEQVATVELTTVDARGIRYSPDGNWLAVWDTASAGCRVLFLTADGHLFKTYSLPQEDLNLGIACVQWSPTGECVAVGDHEGKVTILVKNTVCSSMLNVLLTNSLLMICSSDQG